MSGRLMHTGHIQFSSRHTSAHHLYVDIVIERWLWLSQQLVKGAVTSVVDQSVGILRIFGAHWLSSLTFAFIKPLVAANTPFV